MILAFSLSRPGRSFSSTALAWLALAAPASSQVESWVSYSPQFGDLRDVTLDAAGNMVATGHGNASGSDDCLTVSLDSDGNVRWTATYDSPATWIDRGRAVAADGAGDVVVTGESWTQLSVDCVTIRYDANGQQKWIARSAGPQGSTRRGHDVVVDGSGNVYVTGYYYEGANSKDGFLTIKYNPQGVEQWVALYEGPMFSGLGFDSAVELVVDGLGNVTVTGRSVGVSTGRDYVTIQYDPNGQQRWLARYNGVGSLADDAAGIATDAQGHIYVTGTSANDFVTIEYDTQGNEIWSTRTHAGNETAYDVEVDSAGNVVVTGSSYVAGQPGYLTVRYDGSGVKQWSATRWGLAYAVEVDVHGDVFVTGSYDTVKYDATTGAELWVAPHREFGGLPWTGYAMALDDGGDLFLAGGFVLGRYAPFGFQPYGEATAGSNGVTPQFAGTGTAKVGTAVSLEITGGLGSASGLLLIGAGFGAQVSVPALGGTLLVQPAITIPVSLGGTVGLPGVGALSLPFTVPNAPALIGRGFSFQALFADPGAAAGVSMTNGLTMWIG